MRQPGAKQIAFVVQKHLRFVDQPAKSGRMHDAVAVALEVRSRRRDRLGNTAAARLDRITGVGS